MNFVFDWDQDKANENLHKHSISFREASSVFRDPLLVTLSDTEHSDDEERYWNIGYSAAKKLLVVVFTERGDVTRIISARRANIWERKIYENENIT